MMLSLRGLGSTTPSPQVQAIANAFATAEGGLTPGTFPYRTNNPCDIFVGGSTAGYPTMADGWAACDNQVSLILNDQSSVYNSGMSISQIAALYAPASAGNDPNAWANNVASALGISPSQPLTAVSGGSVAQTSTDLTTGLPALDTATSDATDLSSVLDPSGDSSSGSTDLSFTDDSGNLTGLGWGAIAAAAGLLVWAVAR
jgi:hypothetical protein